MVFKKILPCVKKEDERCTDNKQQIILDETNSDKINSDNDDMAKELMVLIGNAIEEWSSKYDLSNLPKHIVFEQALGIMNAWKDTFRKS